MVGKYTKLVPSWIRKMGARDPLEADHLLESLLNHHINLTVIDSWIRTLRAPRTVFVHNKNTCFFWWNKKGGEISLGTFWTVG